MDPRRQKPILFHGVKSLVVVRDSVIVIRCERHSHEHKLDVMRAGPAQCDLSPTYQGVPVGTWPSIAGWKSISISAVRRATIVGSLVDNVMNAHSFGITGLDSATPFSDHR
jgi:hypothetical protein